jgi:two-component system chemotaxis response regulator CheY
MRRVSMKILVVEDDLIGRKLMEKYLSKFGEIRIAVDGLQALEMISESIENNEVYDVIFLDIMMPKIDGLKVLKTLKEMEASRKLEKRSKIIMITALNDKKTVLEAYDFGCDEYMWKPIDLDKIEEIFKKMNLV